MTDRIAVYAPGQEAQVTMVGTLGFPVIIDSVTINRAGTIVYMVEWWDEGRKHDSVFAEDLASMDTLDQFIVELEEIEDFVEGEGI